MGRCFLVAKVACGWSEEGARARPLFDVCGYGGHCGLFVAMGLMRLTTNGGLFLAWKGWIWVVCGKSVV